MHPSGDSARAKILMIEDDATLCQLTRDYLEPLGFDLCAAHTGPDGLRMAQSEGWNAVILDVLLPGFDGFEILRRLRAASAVPVLMLTGMGSETDRIVGLELGADDYLPKTFSMRELLARLRAVLRRTGAAETHGEKIEPPLVIDSLLLDPASRRATLDGNPLELTYVEFHVLVSLARARGRVLSREQLLRDASPREYDVFDRTIDVHISSLRRKLGEDVTRPRFIQTVRSAGYMMPSAREFHG